MKIEHFILIAIVVAVGLTVSMGRRSTAVDLASENAKHKETIRLQQREAKVLSSIVDNLKESMRDVAYEKAAMELENTYPQALRSQFSQEEWEALVDARADALLDQAASINQEDADADSN